jgi:deoxyribodipyrimidine photo-lyase
MVDPARVRRLNSKAELDGPVVCWISRDQRVRDNWCLLFASELAASRRVPLHAVFCLAPGFLGAARRHYSFMLRGLEPLESSLSERGIPFHLLTGDPAREIPSFAGELNACAVVCDFDPLRLKRRWKSGVARALEVALFEVDTHNIVPCWAVSDKQEYGAYTLRPKIHRELPRFLTEFPTLEPAGSWGGGGADWKAARESVGAEGSVAEVRGWKPGEAEAMKTLERFLEEGLSEYAGRSNDPNSGARSDLSPYLHFGHISAQRVTLEVSGADAPSTAKEAFLEELIVRRELSDNFCFYNRHYDSSKGFPGWAQKTLDEHRDDPREYIYDFRKLERAETHDELWNVAQQEMVSRGKMHSYLRMYWAKKILEWTRSPELALKTAIRLNDRYELDGRDPNGYTGVAWSIGGVHDRAWKERSVFGKIRYMSQAGCRRKFDVDAYIQRVDADAELEKGPASSA